MGFDTFFTFFVLIVGFYMAWNIGANDVSNAMGTSVGSRALTMRKAVIIAAIFEFSGAFLLGGKVSETMQGQLINVASFADPHILIFGMCGALLGTGIWLQIASYFGLPVSTTHAIVGAIIGFGLLTLGVSGIEWRTIGSIALSWVLSPLISGCISFFIFSTLQQKILFAHSPIKATVRILPYILFLVITTFALSFLFNGLGRFKLPLTLFHATAISIFLGAIAGVIGWVIVRRVPLPTASTATGPFPETLISLKRALKLTRRQDVESSPAQAIDPTSQYQFVEKAFGCLQILSACFVAFAHGTNDVANAIAPVAAVLSAIESGTYVQATAIPAWLLAFGGVGIVIGLATWGWRVIETIGRKITDLTPTRGFSAEFGAALTILIASKMGLPISTTHCLVGSVLGVGFARGIRALNLKVLREIILSWIITIPASAIMSIICFYVLRAIFQ